MKNEFKRMRYFDGLTLRAEDYKLDKELHTRIQRLHNRYLHTCGIAHGLEVKSVIDHSREVYVTEGLALDYVEVKDLDGKVKESFSRQILIYDGHPDNPIDLSEYSVGDNIYISVSYNEVLADRNTEKGYGEETHIWERSRINHTKSKEDISSEEIILARVVPRKANREEVKLNKATETDSIIDSTCIFDTYTDGSPLRIYAGPYAKVVELEKFIFKLKEDRANIPMLKGSIDDNDKVCLDVDSASVTFTGSTNVTGNMTLKKSFLCKSKKTTQKEFNITKPYVQLNSKNKSQWEISNGGLEVYRGGTNESPDARVVWCEVEKVWKVGTGNNLFNICGGILWDTLVKKEMCINLHQHRGIYYKNRNVAYFEDNGQLSINNKLAMNGNEIVFKYADEYSGVGWFGNTKLFNELNMMRPIIYGGGGGGLGVTENGQKSVLTWNSSGNIAIGLRYPTKYMLDVEGSLCLLEDSNPIKVTQAWSGFPDSTINRAEISNDTEDYRALMIVGNQSGGQGRKVAISNELDVHGFLYSSGNTDVSETIVPSIGGGSNGIIFQADPGGGWGDRAWIKYYPTYGESCTLEIGTSNDGDDNISLMSAGNVGVGKILPNDKLDVVGHVSIMSSKNPIRFTSDYTDFTRRNLNCAEISNDCRLYKTLMIVGNKSGGQGRKVSIWDRLDVKGLLKVNGSLEVDGAIIPLVGKEDGKGIIFPKDPCGGSGDTAWIKYFSDSERGGKENMTLEIGIANDSNREEIMDRYWRSYCSWCSSPNNNRFGCGHWEYVTRTIYGDKGDRLRLHASGGVYFEGGLYYKSSREYKDNINKLCTDSIQGVFDKLEPVQFNFKGDHGKTTLGFIAEDVPDMLTASDKKAINPLEIITVLVSEIKEQQSSLDKIKKKIESFKI